MVDSSPMFFALLMPWGRVGSNLVSASLNSLPDVVLQNEPTTALRSRGNKAGLPLEDICAQQAQHLDRFVAEVPEGTTAAVLKLSYKSLVDPAAYLSALQAHGFRLTLMVRRNFLKCAVSQQRALVRAAADKASLPWASPWSVKVGEPKPGAVELDVPRTIKATRTFERLHHEMLDRIRTIYGDDFTLVEYEDLAAEPEATARSLFNRWGLTAPDVIEIRHQKATSDQLSEEILNYEEFADAVAKAGLGQYLEFGGDGSSP